MDEADSANKELGLLEINTNTNMFVLYQLETGQVCFSPFKCLTIQEQSVSLFCSGEDRKI